MHRMLHGLRHGGVRSSAALTAAPCTRRVLSHTQRAHIVTWKDDTMSETQFDRMRSIISAPSPVNFEAAMTEGVLVPLFGEFAPDKWGVIRCTGNAGLVVDTDPEDTSGKLTVMVCGHADKIRMQVRHITDDGKVYVDSESFLPATLIGNRVKCFSKNTDGRGFTSIPGTIEALGAIHFAPAGLRNGTSGVKANQLYLELGMHGENRKKQIEDLGIRPGDPLLLDRPIERCVAADTFSGAYLDNGLGCFVALEVARALSSVNLDNVRCQFAFASHEEIGRFGSRVLVEKLRPDVLIAVDVNHDYEAAPIGKEDKNVPLALGKGYTLLHGAICAPALNQVFEDVSAAAEIPVQHDVRGRDSGTDAMAGVLASVDCAATSVGFPIRNMHTVSELAHTSDILASIEAITGVIEALNKEKVTAHELQLRHPRLDAAVSLASTV
eukprot:m.453581 g.453581  ORF g.453581 m.453581 type:complete len:439 (+) comp20523_c0_seq1:60-1376(+)